MCNAPQDHAMFQRLMLIPNCVSCATKLLKPGQKKCHECAAPQPTQASVVHGGQPQPLPHGSQSSYYFQEVPVFLYTCPQPFSLHLSTTSHAASSSSRSTTTSSSRSPGYSVCKVNNKKVVQQMKRSAAVIMITIQICRNTSLCNQHQVY